MEWAAVSSDSSAGSCTAAEGGHPSQPSPAHPHPLPDPLPLPQLHDRWSALDQRGRQVAQAHAAQLRRRRSCISRLPIGAQRSSCTSATSWPCRSLHFAVQMPGPADHYPAAEAGRSGCLEAKLTPAAPAAAAVDAAARARLAGHACPILPFLGESQHFSVPARATAARFWPARPPPPLLGVLCLQPGGRWRSCQRPAAAPT